MIYIILSILAGVTIVFSRIINFRLAKRIGLLQGTFFNYLVGLMFSFIFFILSKESISFSYFHSISLPFWAYLGGIVGILVVAFSSYLTPKVSSFYLTLFIFLGQLTSGLVIDFFTFSDLSIGKIIGVGLVFSGLCYNLIIDKIRSKETFSSYNNLKS